MNDLLNSLIAMRDRPLAEIQQQLSASDSQVESGFGYGNLQQLTKVHNPDASPAHFYFKDKQLVLIYLGDDAALQHFDAQKLQADLGEAAAVLRSRAGKKAQHYVYPQQGIAFSAERATVAFLEIYPAQPLETYKSTLYKEPPVFRK